MPVRPNPTVALIASLAVVIAGCGSQSPASTASPASVAPRESVAPATPEPAGEFPSDVAEGLRTAVDLPYTEEVPCGEDTCTVPLDVLAPEGGGEALPTIVLVPGGPVEFQWRRYADLLAAGLARQGAVVFLISYRNSSIGNPQADSLNDIGCAIRYARSATTEYGGDPQRVVLVGHSLGSEFGLQYAILPESPGQGCVAEGDAIPEAVVGMAGFVFDLSGAAESGPPMWLVGGEDDPQSSSGGEEAAQRLRDAGFQAEFREFADTSHEELVDPEATPGVVDLVFEVVSLTG